MIVVDASVLTDLLLGRRPALEALEVELDGRENEHLHAPELIEPETLNALRRLVLIGEISERRGTEAVSDLEHVRLTRYPHFPLRPRVWELRNTLTAYDATYLALAEALDRSLLLSGDRGLVAAARTALGDQRVRLVR